MNYVLVDSGNQKKIERFGPYTIVRPCSQALWKPTKDNWEGANAHFSRDGGNKWSGSLPKKWVVEHGGIKFALAPTDFGHLGVFPEHRMIWEWACGLIKPQDQVLNLFAYSGGATMALAKAGAQVCHLDASSGMVDWARENAKLNGLSGHPIRWIVDDAMKFLKREIKRGRRYEGILLDPPSFGRGAQGEVFKIERDIGPLLEMCVELLSDRPVFLACTNHTPGMTPIVMQHLMEEVVDCGKIEAGELVLEPEHGRAIPTGTYVRWSSC